MVSGVEVILVFGKGTVRNKKMPKRGCKCQKWPEN